MRSFIIACSLIATVPTLSFADCPCKHRVSQNFSARLKSGLSEMRADSQIVSRLFSFGFIKEQGESDKLQRKYGSAQAMAEQIMAQELASGGLKKVIAVMHTPLPAIPLYTNKEETTTQALLQAGGVLVVAYPAQVREQCTDAHLAIFDHLLNVYPKNFFDMPLECDEISSEMIGATYLLETPNGEWFVFDVRFTQSDNTSAHAGMWFGPSKIGPSAERLARVAEYLRSCQGPDLMAYIASSR